MVKEDMQNYVTYKLMEKPIFLKVVVVPHLFNHPPDQTPAHSLETSQAKIKSEQACYKMKCEDEIEMAGENKSLSEVKVEPFDSYSELIESIEVGEEYKIKPEFLEQNHGDDSNPVEGFERIFVKEEFESASTENFPNQSNQSSSQNSDLVHCPTCNKTWKLISSKLQNKCLQCSSILKYKCGACMKIYSSKNTFYCHVINSHKEPRFSCGYCDYKAPRKNRMEEHVRSAHLPQDSKDPNSNKCPKCDKTYSQRSTLRTHMKTCGLDVSTLPRKTFHCAHCLYKSNYKETLSNHIKSFHQPRVPSTPLQCPKCTKFYANQDRLRRHLKYCGLPAPPRKPPKIRYFCEHCDYKNKYKVSLARHLAKFHPLDPNANKCPKCPKKFAGKISLNKHLLVCGLPVEKQVFRCDHCSFVSNAKDPLVGHVQSKHMNLSFRCKVCDKSFKCQKYLYNHLSRYCQARVKKVLFCDHCKYETTDKASLARHIQAKHSSEKFACECGKLFSSQWALKEHNRYSCGKVEKRLGCDECDFRTNYRSSMVSHKQSKHSGMVFKCEKCGKSLSHEVALRRHEKVCKRVV